VPGADLALLVFLVTGTHAQEPRLDSSSVAQTVHDFIVQYLPADRDLMKPPAPACYDFSE